jgi:hypothetical protein
MKTTCPVARYGSTRSNGASETFTPARERVLVDPSAGIAQWRHREPG